MSECLYVSEHIRLPCQKFLVILELGNVTLIMKMTS